VLQIEVELGDHSRLAQQEAEQTAQLLDSEISALTFAETAAWTTLLLVDCANTLHTKKGSSCKQDKLC